MKIRFEMPTMEIIRFDGEDVLSVSSSTATETDVPPTTEDWETPFIPTP